MKPYYEVGVHVGRVIQQALTESNGGTPQFLLRVKVLGRGLADGSYEPHGQQFERSIYLPLTEKTLEWVVPQLQAIGFTGRSIAQLDPDHPQAHSFVGQDIDLYCGRDEYKGVEKEKWGISSGPKEFVSKTLDPKALRKLDALFGKALGSKAVPVKPTAPDVEDDTEITDEDIPF